MSGLSAPSLKLAVRHPSLLTRVSQGSESQLDVDRRCCCVRAPDLY